ncbi:MAG: DUF2793 domain-containing protein [Xanthobacteraceae bacterium]
METPNLALPFIEAAQSQKHVTHNDALRIIDAVVQLAVAGVTSAPPGAPADGERHIVGPAPSDAFAGHENEIAVWQDGAWVFLTPQVGWRAWDADADLLRIWNGSAWIEFTTAGPDDRVTVDYLGVGTAADETSTDTSNRLTVRGSRALFDAIPESETPGSGDFKVQISKEAVGKTASFFFADNFSGRAELGLIADDDFRLKVSPDGAAFSTSFVIDKDTGNVALADLSDANNRLLVNGQNVLLTNAGELNLSMSKGAAGDNLQLIFNTNFSQRAAFGLLGDDDFCVQVTPDGSNFYRTVRAHRNLFGRATIRDAARRQDSEWRPRPNSTTVDQLGLGLTLNVGTATVAAVSSTSFWTNAKRILYASAAGAGSSAQIHGNDLVVWRGNSGDRGGFFLLMRVAFEVHQAQARMFAGLRGALTAIGNVNPSTLTNVIGIGYDSAETQMALIHNDGANGATKAALGAAFVVGGHEVYELMLACEPFGSAIQYRVERLNGGDVATGTISTDIPAATQFLTPVLWGNNGTTAAAVQIGFARMYLENASMFGSRGFALQ